MDNWEQSTANELIQGMEMAKQLKLNFNSISCSTETQQLLLQGILSSYNNALLIVNGNGSSALQPQQVAAATLDSPEGSPGASKGYEEHTNVSKKR